MAFEPKKKSFEQIQKEEYNRILAKETKKAANEEARKEYIKEFEPKKFKKEERERKLKPIKETVNKVGKYMPTGSLGTNKGLKRLMKKSQKPSIQEQIRKHFNEPVRQNIPYHVDMAAERDNGYRPHEAQSLVKVPDVEGYKRNLLLQPSRNIWEEPRKRNVWDETFNPTEKKKSIFEK
jgi:hypothetical protein